MKNLVIILIIFSLSSCNSLKNSKEENKQETKTTQTEMKIPTIEDLQNKTWVWVNTKLNDGTIVTPKENSLNIIFGKDNKLNISSDCNNGSSTFTLENKSLKISPIMATKKFCPDSKERIFFKNLMAANSIFLKDGNLFIELKIDSGTMEFITK
jgi:heat shock protein HslJ